MSLRIVRISCLKISTLSKNNNPDCHGKVNHHPQRICNYYGPLFMRKAVDYEWDIKNRPPEPRNNGDARYVLSDVNENDLRQRHDRPQYSGDINRHIQKSFPQGMRGIRLNISRHSFPQMKVKHRSTLYLTKSAGDVGIEPTMSVLETEVIPFN